MERSSKRQKPPEVSTERRTSNELVKLIRKLRWMGLEEEAKRVQTKLVSSYVEPTDSVVAASRETD